MHAASTLASETTNPIGLPWGEVLIAGIAFVVLLGRVGQVRLADVREGLRSQDGRYRRRHRPGR